MKFILGKKVQMTEIFDEKGRSFAVTIVSAQPMSVTQVKNVAKDGYNAVQYGSFTTKKSLSKPQVGHLKDQETYSLLKELRVEGEPTASLKDVVTVADFTVGDDVEVSGTSKSKGFQGVVKRHGFSGGRRSHGNKHAEREPGSISGGLRTRVPKGMRMGGRMGGDRVTVKSLKVMAINADKNEIYISGAVPGRRGTVLEIRSK